MFKWMETKGFPRVAVQQLLRRSIVMAMFIITEKETKATFHHSTWLTTSSMALTWMETVATFVVVVIAVVEVVPVGIRMHARLHQLLLGSELRAVAPPAVLLRLPSGSPRKAFS
jgi:hypothetical protein